MRSLLFSSLLAFSLILGSLACSSKPSSSNSSDTPAATPDSTAATATDSAKETREHKEHKKEPIVVPAGTAITVSLGSALGSKLSQVGQTFTGSVAKDVLVRQAVAIPQGTNVSGTVTDAKPLGKLAGGAMLQVRLDSIAMNGSDIPVQAAARTFTQKGKGKRTAVMAGGGAALGGLIGGLAGGGKGAAIGAAAGAGAGTGGSALTANKDIVLPAESAVTFELSQALEVRR